MSEVDKIKAEHFEAIRNGEVILVARGDYGWDVGHWLPEGVAPTTGYDTAHEAGARVLQLMGLANPVTPQNWPENVGIGTNLPPPPKPGIV